LAGVNPIGTTFGDGSLLSLNATPVIPDPSVTRYTSTICGDVTAKHPSALKADVGSDVSARNWALTFAGIEASHRKLAAFSQRIILASA
jgi:hypothetical protein